MKKLLTEDSIEISTPASRVWEVLVSTQYIKQWDDVPENFKDASLQLGSVLHWEGYSKLTVSRFEPGKLLKMNLHGEKWTKPESAYDIAYTYTLVETNGATRLTLTIGDFGVLPEGQSYYDASIEFGATALKKIKELAEGK